MEFEMREVFIFAAFCLAIWGAAKDAEIHENKRLERCLTSPDYSGIAWIGDDKLFTCSSDIKKGKVYYNKKGE